MKYRIVKVHHKNSSYWLVQKRYYFIWLNVWTHTNDSNDLGVASKWTYEFKSLEQAERIVEDEFKAFFQCKAKLKPVETIIKTYDTRRVIES